MELLFVHLEDSKIFALHSIALLSVATHFSLINKQGNCIQAKQF